MAVSTDKEVFGFQTEVKQLLHLVIHSLYSNPDIFLRELVSNASDALDKLRFLSLDNSDLLGNESDLAIQVEFDKELRTVTVRDNGLGMSREEVIDNLGTIAKSGTKAFLSNLTGDQAKDSQLIGQFGVGFYAAFIVADKVTVKTRKVGLDANDAVLWESDGSGEYAIEAATKASRGTEITLHLKPEMDDYLSDYKLKNIIQHYSDHISWPILMKMPKPEVTDSDEENKDDNIIDAEVFEPVNKAKALWTQSKSDISDEDYQEFYKHISHDFEVPLAWMHNRVEGKQEYTTLLFIPKKAPFDLWQQDYRSGLKLFVKRVFIMDEADQFIPRYLRFVKGIVDSNDLPLNVSREILQDNKAVESIKASCIKRVLNSLEKMAKNDGENYQNFWKEFGLVFKEGPVEDAANREKIASLLRFSSTHTDSEEQNVSLDDYISRMKDDQKHIYYITAESFNAAKNSPHLEVFRKNGIEVLLLVDRIDEWLVSHIGQYQEKDWQSITKGELDLKDIQEDISEEEQKQEQETFEAVINKIKDELKERVKDVRLTHRLTQSPACIVAGVEDMNREMQRILKAAGQAVPDSKPILELNPEHLLLKKMQADVDNKHFSAWTHILFDQAVLAEGGQLEDPASFVMRMNELLLDLAG